MSLIVRVWMPPKHDDYLSCKGYSCYGSIRSGDIYSIEEWQVSYLTDKAQQYNITTLKCFKCTIVDIINNSITNYLDPANSQFNHKFKMTLAELCRTPVREELHKIIREECADPNGPISPGPTP